MRLRCAIGSLTALAVLMLSGCATPTPTPSPNAVVNFRNLSGSALLVGVTSGEVEAKAVLRPCGGEASLATVPPPVDDPRIMMGALYDGTGALDVAVEQAPPGSLDPKALGDRTFTAMIWSRGDIGIDDLPKWITFHAGTTQVSDSAPTETAPVHCDPWPTSE